MRKKILFAGSMAFLLLFIVKIALGQTVYYCDGCVRNGLCPVSRSFSTCAEATASGRLSCPGGGWRVDCDKTEDGPVMDRKKFTSPLGNGIMGAMLGGLGFSLLNDKNGNNQWMMGAAGGYFFFSSLTFIAEPKSRPLGASIFLGALNGATGGTAAGQAIQYFKVQKSTPTEPAKEDKITLPATLGGAVLGGITGAVTFKSKRTKGGDNSFRMRKSKLSSNTVFIMSGNRMGIIVKL